LLWGIKMTDYYYSAKNNGFYPGDLKSDYESSLNGWPDDAVVVSESDHKKLLDGQSSGKVISSNSDGYPVLSDRPEPTQEELTAAAEMQRDELKSEATEKIILLQDAVDIGDVSDTEKESLIAWKKYRISLNRLDLSAAPDINWPAKPE